ncbi:hypothetical protein GCM10009753_21590 [Streptantibioticus ferralitis]
MFDAVSAPPLRLDERVHRPPGLLDRNALSPLRSEIAGGTTAIITFGPVNDILAPLDQHL